MTLDEAIIHAEEVAEEKEREAEYRQETQGDMFKFLDDLSKSVGGEGIENDALNECLECASEHRQLAEWLRELKAYRKAEKEIEQELVNWNDIDNGKCRGLFLATSIIQHYKNGEVNADDE